MLNILEEIQKTITQAPALLIIQWVLQCYFFSRFLSKLLGTVLKIINFPYADTISNNYFVILGFAALLMYLRLWSSWSGWFLTLAFASGCIVALYVYDCTCNISQAYAYNIEFNYLVQVALYLVVTSAGVGCMYWAHPSEMYYVVPMVCVIFVVNFVRRRHIIHSVLMIGSILMYVGGQWLCKSLITEQGYCGLPLQVIPLLMMAFDAQHREAAKIRGGADSIIREVLKMSTYFLLYALLNAPLHFQYCLFGIWLFAQFLLK